MNESKLSIVDTNIIVFFIEKLKAKSGYAIAKKYGQVENRRFYSERLKLYQSQNLVYIDSEGYYRLRLTENSPQMQNYLRALCESKEGVTALKRIINEGKTVKSITKIRDIEELLKSKKIIETSEKALNSLKI